jgi:hypothetical protein
MTSSITVDAIKYNAAPVLLGLIESMLRAIRVLSVQDGDSVLVRNELCWTLQFADLECVVEHAWWGRAKC